MAARGFDDLPEVNRIKSVNGAENRERRQPGGETEGKEEIRGKLVEKREWNVRDNKRDRYQLEGSR
jgi:hypothetical protein